uniref:IS4 family transposase n=1 Tax=Rhizobium meliloti TaxID=382 RepID=I2E1Q1_RHIML|nr:IS4 family transposase [Sinorhizobium meliloti]
MIGPKLKARHFDNKKTEAKIGVRVRPKSDPCNSAHAHALNPSAAVNRPHR